MFVEVIIIGRLLPLRQFTMVFLGNALSSYAFQTVHSLSISRYILAFPCYHSIRNFHNVFVLDFPRSRL